MATDFEKSGQKIASNNQYSGGSSSPSSPFRSSSNSNLTDAQRDFINNAPDTPENIARKEAMQQGLTGNALYSHTVSRSKEIRQANQEATGSELGKPDLPSNPYINQPTQYKVKDYTQTSLNSNSEAGLLQGSYYATAQYLYGRSYESLSPEFQANVRNVAENSEAGYYKGMKKMAQKVASGELSSNPYYEGMTQYRKEGGGYGSYFEDYVNDIRELSNAPKYTTPKTIKTQQGGGSSLSDKIGKDFVKPYQFVGGNKPSENTQTIENKYSSNSDINIIAPPGYIGMNFNPFKSNDQGENKAKIDLIQQYYNLPGKPIIVLMPWDKSGGVALIPQGSKDISGQEIEMTTTMPSPLKSIGDSLINLGLVPIKIINEKVNTEAIASNIGKNLQAVLPNLFYSKTTTSKEMVESGRINQMAVIPLNILPDVHEFTSTTTETSTSSDEKGGTITLTNVSSKTYLSGIGDINISGSYEGLKLKDKNDFFTNTKTEAGKITKNAVSFIGEHYGSQGRGINRPLTAYKGNYREVGYAVEDTLEGLSLEFVGKPMTIGAESFARINLPENQGKPIETAGLILKGIGGSASAGFALTTPMLFSTPEAITNKIYTENWKYFGGITPELEVFGYYADVGATTAMKNAQMMKIAMSPGVLPTTGSFIIGYYLNPNDRIKGGVSSVIATTSAYAIGGELNRFFLPSVSNFNIVTSGALTGFGAGAIYEIQANKNASPEDIAITGSVGALIGGGISGLGIIAKEGKIPSIHILDEGRYTTSDLMLGEQEHIGYAGAWVEQNGKILWKAGYEGAEFNGRIIGNKLMSADAISLNILEPQLKSVAPASEWAKYLGIKDIATMVYTKDVPTKKTLEQVFAENKKGFAIGEDLMKEIKPVEGRAMEYGSATAKGKGLLARDINDLDTQFMTEDLSPEDIVKRISSNLNAKGWQTRPDLKEPTQLLVKENGQWVKRWDAHAYEGELSSDYLKNFGLKSQIPAQEGGRNIMKGGEDIARKGQGMTLWQVNEEGTLVIAPGERRGKDVVDFFVMNKNALKTNMLNPNEKAILSAKVQAQMEAWGVSEADLAGVSPKASQAMPDLSFNPSKGIVAVSPSISNFIKISMPSMSASASKSSSLSLPSMSVSSSKSSQSSPSSSASASSPSISPSISSPSISPYGSSSSASRSTSSSASSFSASASSSSSSSSKSSSSSTNPGNKPPGGTGGIPLPFTDFGDIGVKSQRIKSGSLKSLLRATANVKMPKIRGFKP